MRNIKDCYKKCKGKDGFILKSDLYITDNRYSVSLALIKSHLKIRRLGDGKIRVRPQNSSAFYHRCTNPIIEFIRRVK